MAPNKFEKQLKDTLEGRTIAPSQNAWSQLDAALQTQENKNKRSFWWLGIAATFLGLFLAIYIFKNNNTKLQPVVEEVKTKTLSPSKTNSVKDVPVVNTQINKVNNNTIVKQNKPIIANTTITNTSNDAKSKTNAELPITNNIKVITPEVKKELNTIVINENPITREATLLLEEAYSEVKEKNNLYQVEKIDANSLLEEVEIQSEKSLKNRLFHAVKSGYQTLKTTVAERNN